MLLAPVLYAQEPQSPIIHTPEGPAAIYSETRLFINGKELTPQEVDLLRKVGLKEYLKNNTQKNSPIERDGDKVLIHGHELPEDVAKSVIDNDILPLLQAPVKRTAPVPQEAEVIRPEPVKAVRPEPVKVIRPEHVKVVRPEPVKVIRPEHVKVVRPEPVKVIRPEHVKVVRPEPVKVIRPEHVKVVRPEPVKVIRPEHVKVVRPEPVKVIRPEPVKVVRPEPKKQDCTCTPQCTCTPTPGKPACCAPAPQPAPTPQASTEPKPFCAQPCNCGPAPKPCTCTPDKKCGPSIAPEQECITKPAEPDTPVLPTPALDAMPAPAPASPLAKPCEAKVIINGKEVMVPVDARHIKITIGEDGKPVITH